MRKLCIPAIVMKRKTNLWGFHKENILWPGGLKFCKNLMKIKSLTGTQKVPPGRLSYRSYPGKPWKRHSFHTSATCYHHYCHLGASAGKAEPGGPQLMQEPSPEAAGSRQSCHLQPVFLTYFMSIDKVEWSALILFPLIFTLDCD